MREAEMDVSLFYPPLSKRMAARYKDFLSSADLRDEGDADVIALMTDDNLNIVACGARAKNTVKQFAVSPDYMSSTTAWVATLAYTFQIYFDFSGYSDMAIGIGKMLGFDFMENFEYPYLAGNITEFWRRWHISLGSWFREYVYIPLGGNRVSVGRHILNLLIVWALTGLWHGANWNFVIWGLYYGVILILEKYVLIPLCRKVPKWIKHIYTMLLVIIGWAIFSNTNFADMGVFLKNLFGGGVNGFIDSGFLYYFKSNLILLILSVFFCAPAFKKVMGYTERKRPVINIVVCILIFILSVGFLVSGSFNPFLYFRF